MKRFVWMIIFALICGLALTGCTADKAEPELIDPNGLYVIGTKAGISPANMTDLVFTGDDIVSFELITGEIVFTKEKTDKIISRARLYSDLLYRRRFVGAFTFFVISSNPSVINSFRFLQS